MSARFHIVAGVFKIPLGLGYPVRALFHGVRPILGRESRFPSTTGGEKSRLFLLCVVAALVAALTVACTRIAAESRPEPSPALATPESTEAANTAATATPGAIQRTPVSTSSSIAVDTPTPTILAHSPGPTQSPLASPIPIATVGQVPQTQPGTVDPLALAQRAWAFLTELTREHSPRASATDQEARAADYLAGVYRNLGYDTTIQTFDVTVLVTDPPVLRVIPSGGPGSVPREPVIDAQPLRLSAEATASGLLAHVGLVLDDLPAGSLKGKVALIERGIVGFEMKVSRVTQAGAVAAVIYNNEPGQFSGTLTSQARIPAVSISQEAGQDLRNLIAAGEMRATVSVVFETRPSRNVVAERKVQEASQEASKVVVLGGHFDTVPKVPGANDNGSGVATLLAIAEAIKGRDYPFTVRLIDFGAEELGLEGSRHYLAVLSPEERRRIVAMLNFDALGTGASGVYGTDDLANRALSSAETLDLGLTREASIQGGSSDFASFEAAGVPFLFFLASDFSLIHSPEDTLDHVDSDALGTAAAVAIEILDSLERAN